MSTSRQIADLRVVAAHVQGGVLVHVERVLRERAIDVGAREDGESFHLVASAVLEQPLRCRRRSTSWRSSGSKSWRSEPQVGDRVGPLAAEDVLDAAAPEIGVVERDLARSAFPRHPIDSVDLVLAGESASEKPSEPTEIPVMRSRSMRGSCLCLSGPKGPRRSDPQLRRVWPPGQGPHPLDFPVGGKPCNSAAFGGIEGPWRLPAPFLARWTHGGQHEQTGSEPDPRPGAALVPPAPPRGRRRRRAGLPVPGPSGDGLVGRVQAIRPRSRPRRVRALRRGLRGLRRPLRSGLDPDPGSGRDLPGSRPVSRSSWSARPSVRPSRSCWQGVSSARASSG